MDGMFFVRPYCFEFLNELNKYYEIVTFTNGMKSYADSILNLLDINDNIIKYRLYRQHVSVTGFSRFKNLTLLGRDLKKTIIIDNLKENFHLQPDNGLYIKSWTSDVNDTQFIDLLDILILSFSLKISFFFKSKLFLFFPILLLIKSNPR